MTAAIAHDVDIVQTHLNMVGLEIVNARIADRGKYPPEVRVGSEKRGLDQRRVRDRIRDLARLLSVRACSTRTSMNLVAPSPSRTIACASLRATSVKAAEKAVKSGHRHRLDSHRDHAHSR